MQSFPIIGLRARLGFVLCAFAALASCGMGPGAFGNSGAAPIGATRLIERDVEAPEVFEVTEEGLWDGRASLGGVWVAHPTATGPERVIIRNEENGRFVIGALFRRDRDAPGASLMVSSDAAAALGIGAADPTRVQVTALRREDPADRPGPTNAAVAVATISGPVAPAQPVAPVAAVTTGSAALARPFVQIGIFSVQENANSTMQVLRNGGLVPTLYDQESNGRRFWRVVVGPAQSIADRDAMIGSVRRLGFQDAYVVAR